MLKYLLGLAIVIGSLCVPIAARATCGTLPYTFTNNPNGSVVDANTTNANNQFLLSCASSIDNTQIGPNGIFASQVLPTTVAQATFGGSQPYTFPSTIGAAGLTSTGNIVVNNGVFDTPSGTPGQFCSGANCLVVAANGNTSVPIDFTVGRNAAVTGSLQAGSVTSIGNLAVNNGVLTTGGTLQLCSGSTCINMTSAGNVTVPNALTVTSTINALANLTTTTDVAVGRNLGVTGTSTLNVTNITSSGYITKAGTSTYPYDSGTFNSNDHIERGSQASGGGVVAGGYTFKTAYGTAPTCTVSATGAGNTSSITSITTTYVQWQNSAAGITALVICIGA